MVQKLPHALASGLKLAHLQRGLETRVVRADSEKVALQGVGHGA